MKQNLSEPAEPGEWEYVGTFGKDGSQILETIAGVLKVGDVLRPVRLDTLFTVVDEALIPTKAHKSGTRLVRLRADSEQALSSLRPGTRLLRVGSRGRVYAPAPAEWHVYAVDKEDFIGVVIVMHRMLPGKNEPAVGDKVVHQRTGSELIIAESTLPDDVAVYGAGKRFIRLVGVRLPEILVGDVIERVARLAPDLP